MELLLILVCIIFASFFAGLETGLLSADHLMIFSKKEEGVFSASLADFLLQKPERLLGTTLIGTNIAVVSASIIFSNYLRNMGVTWLIWPGSLFLTIVLLIFSEIIPKIFFKAYANTISVALTPVLMIFYYLFFPVSFILNGIISVFLFLTGQRSGSEKLPKSREDFKHLVKLSSRETGRNFSDYKVFEDIFDFSGTMAREVMLPFYKYPVCHIDKKPEDLVELFLSTNLRYLPIYTDRTDNIAGYIDVEDLLRKKVSAIKEIVNKAVYYPDTKRIPELLKEMDEKSLDIVFLSDEYGSIAGIVTPLEISSEITGFIPGMEHTAKENIRMISDDKFIVSGDTDLEDLYHETGIDVKKGNYETIGGYICNKIGIIPPVQTVFKDKNAVYKIVEANSRHLETIEINRIK